MATAKKILIVDDEPHILRSLGFVLKRAGYQVMEARSGIEALQIAQEQQPDIVFLDIMMPELDGYEVCRRLREDPNLADTRVVMLTAKGEEADRRRGYEAGAHDYMTKPFSPSRAVARVEEMLQP